LHNWSPEQTQSGRLKVKRLENQIILKSLGVRKPNDLRKIAKIGYGYKCRKKKIPEISQEFFK
jgi:hypothetical protein